LKPGAEKKVKAIIAKTVESNPDQSARNCAEMVLRIITMEEG
jgi:hypothetical protein